MNDKSSWYQPLDRNETPEKDSFSKEERKTGGRVYDSGSYYYRSSPNEDFSYQSDSVGSRSDGSARLKVKKGLHGVFPVLGLIFLAIILVAITISVLVKAGTIKSAFGKNDSEAGSFNSDASEHSGTDDGFIWNFGDAPSGGFDSDTEDEDTMPDEWSEFFENYFTPSETTAARIDIPRASLPINYTMLLQQPGADELSLQQLYSQCSNSVVAIKGYVNKEEYSWGTGVILSSNGLIITNTHVIDGCDGARVVLWNDEEYEAKLVGADTSSDIAVLLIEANGLPAASFCESDYLQVGDKVVAIGNPLGPSFRTTLTDGIISGTDRGVSYNGRTMTVLQTNTALNSGNSGGPLFNMYGQVIGITNMKMMSSYSSIEGIGFAIPSNNVEEIVISLLVNGEYKGRPSIGMTVGAIPESAKEQYSLPSGLYVTDVNKGSGADKAGVQVKDIVTKVNGVEVSTTNDVVKILDTCSVGDILTVTIWRDGKLFDLEIELMDYTDIFGA